MNYSRSRSATLTAACLFGLISSGSYAQSVTATVDVQLNGRGTPMPPTFYGLMTEEINHAYDGGLYAELIQNRTFQDDDRGPAHWSPVGGATIDLDRDEPVNWANPVCLRVGLKGGTAGAANDGYWGIPVTPATKYAVSFYAKGGGGFAGPVTAANVGDDGVEYAKATSDAVGAAWKKYTVSLDTAADIKATHAAKFVLTATGTGTVSFTLVSVFPPTYMDTPGGLRPDLMKMMADLKPSFVRLPGGNYLEGDTFATRYNWKRQIGPVDERPGHRGCWGYRSSDGMGLPQMLLWCKQLNAEPVLGVFAGYTLNRDHVDAGPDMQPFVDEALEEIEYITGGPETNWGKRRIADGFPEPFKLTYVEIGNEDWFDISPSYDGRYRQMHDAIKAKYPQLKLIATAPVHSRKPDLYDDHFYQSANAMVNDSNHYDAPKNADAKAQVRYADGRFNGTFARGQVPDVFCGEWATQEGRPTPSLRAALADSVWLMGLERNADLVKLQCYAPLFVNVNDHAWQWGTNLIGYDATAAFGSPSYYAQMMFAQNKADVVLPTTLTMPARQTAVVPRAHGAVGLGAWHTDAEYKDFKVVGPNGNTLLDSAAGLVKNDWVFNGDWTTQGGTLKPTNPAGETWGTIGDARWSDYTVSVKARKNGGDEGFLVLWHAADAETYNWWNVGGWNNSRTQAEIAREGVRTAYGPASKFHAETGKWYDLRVEIRGGHARCFIDNVLVTDATNTPTPPPPQPMFASAGYAKDTGDVIVKIVNYSASPIDATLHLRGAKSIRSAATSTVISGNPGDVNTLAEPKKIVPREESIPDASASMKRTFPPYSLTLLRVGAAVD